jgi:hypothetical protein
VQYANVLRTIGIVLTAAMVLVAFGGTAAAQTADGQMGICVVGADSPCNGEQWDGDVGGDADVPGADAPSVDLPGTVDGVLGAV